METREIGIQRGVPTQQLYDPDTSFNIKIANATLKTYGREKIIINASLQDFYSNPYKVFVENISDIMAIHNRNVADINYLNAYYRGKQDVLDKKRANGDSIINNKSVTNYAWEFVNFKKGYYVGKPIKYVDLNSEEDYDDIKYLNRYNRNIRKASKDLVKYENMFINGIAYTMTIPKRTDYNIEKESPYEYIVLDNKDVCVVRANDVEKSKLFSMCISEMIDENKIPYLVYTLYYSNKCLQIKTSNNGYEIINEHTMPVYDCITEYQLNEQRMGVFEVVISNMNILNTINSNQIDEQEEEVNHYLKFKNVDVAEVESSMPTFRRNRMLVCNTNGNGPEADVDVLNFDNDHTSINNKYSEMEQRMYDIVGVPMPTSSTGQGVSGEAQVYGGGWENAQIIALVDTNYILQYEEEDLEKFIDISANAKNSKTLNLISSDIDIKYTINKSNNIMTKAQAGIYFIEHGFTREQALTLCEISDDPQTDGKIADDNWLKTKRIEMELEVEKAKLLNSETNSNIKE